MVIKTESDYIILELSKNISELIKNYDVNLYTMNDNMYKLYIEIEKIHWFYLDNYVYKYKYKHYTLTKFIYKIYELYNIDINNNIIIKEYVKIYYKKRQKLPLSGCVIFNKAYNKVLLVKNKGSKSWSFPKGKIEYMENPLDCAIREVYEETGLNIENIIDENISIESTLRGVKVYLYVINIEEVKNFAPQIQNEISEVKWHSLKNISYINKNYVVLVRNLSNKINQLSSYYSDYIIDDSIDILQPIKIPL